MPTSEANEFNDDLTHREHIGEMPVARARRVVETLRAAREEIAARVVRTKATAAQGFVAFIEKELKKVNAKIAKIDKLLTEAEDLLKGLES